MSEPMWDQAKRDAHADYSEALQAKCAAEASAGAFLAQALFMSDAEAAEFSMALAERYAADVAALEGACWLWREENGYPNP